MWKEKKVKFYWVDYGDRVLIFLSGIRIFQSGSTNWIYFPVAFFLAPNLSQSEKDETHAHVIYGAQIANT